MFKTLAIFLILSPGLNVYSVRGNEILPSD
jgi:hypothetical protein